MKREKDYIDGKVNDLLTEMTIEEKTAQTFCCYRAGGFLNESGKFESGDLKGKIKHGVGAFLSFMNLGYDPYKSAVAANEMQRYIIENTRLGIPALMQEECLHGHLARGATIFPVPIALAGTFDTDLIKEIFSVIAAEIRARGGNQAFGPVLDIGRDPRWGRIEETYGEDTYLVSQMGLAAVLGLQGDSRPIGKDKIIASPKHFAGYGQSAGGRNFAPTDISERIFNDQILVPFKMAVKKGNVLGIMPSHADIDGVMCHANKRLLTGLLREKWGFDGVVVSDCNDIARLSGMHHVAKDIKDAAVKALNAGVDIDLPGGEAFMYLTEAAKKDESIAKNVELSAARVLRAKFELGLFDDPYVDPDYAKQTVNCDKHKKTARKAAEKSIVLLKNEGGILPLDRSVIKKIAIIGPNAHPVQLGGYSPKPYRGISILDGIKEKLKGSVEIIYAQGCGITKNDDFSQTELDADIVIPELFKPEEEEEAIAKAVYAASLSDVAVVCVGGNYLTAREAIGLRSHLGDIADTGLAGQQDLLVKAVYETGTPVVVVLINGRPLSTVYIVENIPAVIEAWYAGQETGHAVADVLFGDVDPAGRLPVSIPRSSGHLPVYYSQKPSGEFKEYLFSKSSCLYPFGHGLSYTTFRYDYIKVEPEIFDEKMMCVVAVGITNTGSRRGDEVVQVYIRDVASSITRPVKELKRFSRITLDAGASTQINFNVLPEDLAFTDEGFRFIAEAGEFIISAGNGKTDIIQTRLYLNEDIILFERGENY